MLSSEAPREAESVSDDCSSWSQLDPPQSASTAVDTFDEFVSARVMKLIKTHSYQCRAAPFLLTVQQTPAHEQHAAAWIHTVSCSNLSIFIHPFTDCERII